MNTEQQILLESIGVDLIAKREIPLAEDWLCYSLNHDNPTKEIPIILINNGPKKISEVKKALINFEDCIVIVQELGALFLKSSGESHITRLENRFEYERIASVLKSNGITDAADEFDLKIGIKQSINAIPNTTGDFDNRGLFATHYLRSRIFQDTRQDVDDILPKVKQKIGSSVREILEALGWDMTKESYDKVAITITDQEDFNIRKTDNEVTPSYTAVSSLSEKEWSILTNGKRWRLYSSKISATSTNYFEINLDDARESVTRYLIIMFGANTFEEIDGKRDIELFFEESKEHSRDLEENLAEKIMSPKGLFLDIIKGVLDHDGKKTFRSDELAVAKQSALRIMYRVWFLAYAEAKNLLPTRDEKYKPISLQSIRNHLDSYEQNPKGTDCWDALLELFTAVRKGSPKHNLPQYNGDLFKIGKAGDELHIQNRFIASALRGLLERDGETLDYTGLTVRHLGSVFERLLEYEPKQAKEDIALLEDSKGVRQVKTKQESTYSYKKNDLYLASKSGIVSRKTSASYYTPEKIVKFLVKQGLGPIFAEREELIDKDIKQYKKNKTAKNLQICMDRLLDIQVLDPAMGSGHFLVEALNRITSWVTDTLEKHPDHPLLDEIERDRKRVLEEQNKKGVTIDENLLTPDVLLKRKIMKRCIFGVDINPMAVDLAKLSLWLDSFAIGVPLTYMDHHLKVGDSTIGMFLDDLDDKQNTSLDDYTLSNESTKMMHDIVSSSDVTIQQVHESEDKYNEYIKSIEPNRNVLDALTASKIEPKILPKKAKSEFIHRFGIYDKSNDIAKAQKIVNDLAERHRFFHWELEFNDAFTDSRRGFDCIVGNPPWEKVKPSDDEFFTPIDPTFKDLKPNVKKKERKKDLLKEHNIKRLWDLYEKQIREKSLFYNIFSLQGTGDNDLWKLILERTLYLTTENGIVSILIPAQLLTIPGGINLRKYILERDIISMYVFENRKKIFNIHSSYRFLLLTIQDRTGQDRTGQDRTGQDRTGQDRTGQDRTGQDRTGQDRTGQDRTGQDRTGQDRTGQDRTGQDRTGQDRTGQDRTGQDRTGQDRTGQDRTGQDRTGQDRTGQDRTGQDRTGQDSSQLGFIYITLTH